MRAPYPHQAAGLSYAAKHDHPALFMEMRLGKSLVAIRDCVAKGLGRVLVLAPKTTLYSWEKELKLERQRRIVNLNPRNAATRRWLEAHEVRWGLCSYEYLLANPSISNAGWDAVILDESTCIKNPKADLTKFMLREFPQQRRYILSGRPTPEDPLEIVCQWIFLRGECLGARDYWTFRKKHCRPPYPGQYDWNLDVRSRKKLEALFEQEAFYVTRQSAGVEKIKSYEVRLVNETAAQKKATLELLEKFETGLARTKWTVVVANWVQQIAGGFFREETYSDNKVRELVAFMQELPRGEKVVVFFRFTQELQACEDALRRAGISALTLLGETSRDERARAAGAFSLGAKGAPQVLLAQTKCVKYGMDFAAADTVVYFSNSFSLEERLQSEQRIVHLQKERPLLYVDLATENSIDMELITALEQKDEISKAFLESALLRMRSVRR